jgi:hypothetical protein
MQFKNFTYELKKLNFGNATKALLSPSLYRGAVPQSQHAFMPDIFPIGNNTTNFFSYTNLASAIYAYENCPPLNAIVNRKALAFINAEISVINSVGSLSNSPQAKKLMKIFKSPNKLQTRAQFLAQLQIYIDLVGFAIILPIIPVGYENISDADSFWVLPPSTVELVQKNKRY